MDLTSLKYAKTHEWVKLEGDTATIGITDFAVQALTDLVYIGLPAAGKQLSVGQVFGEVESVKAGSDLDAPLPGEVAAANTKLEDDLGKLSDDPFGAGWLIKLKVSDTAGMGELLDRAAYEDYCASQAH